MDELIESFEDYSFYALRFTPFPQEKETVNASKSLLSLLIQRFTQHYLIGCEYEKNWHFHAVFATVKPLDKSQKEEFKNHLYMLLSVPEDKKGNASYSLQYARNPRKALAYAVKDGDYHSSNTWGEIASLSYEESTTKKHSMKSALSTLTEKYKKNQINDRTLWLELGYSRAELGIPLSVKWVDDMFLSIKVAKSKQVLIDIWEDREMRKANK